MKWKHNFKHVDSSESLKQYAEERFQKLEKLLLKDSQWHIHYSMGKWDCRVEVVVTNPDSRFKASSVSDDLYDAVDIAAHKLSKQFFRRKERLQSHKKSA